MASQEGPPGYDPPTDAKPKTKSVKRNERKKEKRLQVLLLQLFSFLFLLGDQRSVVSQLASFSYMGFIGQSES